MIPSVAIVAAHESRGGLWRASFNGARVPIFVRLRAVNGQVCEMSTDARSTAEMFAELSGATWTAVDGDGDRL